ncbi:NHX7, partial [Symbiodinium sp. KB8]
MVRYFKGLQQTVALFITGIIIALIHNAVPVESRYASWETSWQMWMDIDPHLLLFTMLPSLLMADAMTIHTGVAMRVAKQCIYLAGPGVLINALLAACFLYVYLPYQWPFLLCLTTGSILCATDPVAVVALLKELGASPTLTAGSS